MIGEIFRLKREIKFHHQLVGDNHGHSHSHDHGGIDDYTKAVAEYRKTFAVKKML